MIRSVAQKHNATLINGQDISQDILNICEMMFILNNKQEQLKNIQLGNTLMNLMNTKNGELQKFDCIVTSPLFALKN